MDYRDAIKNYKPINEQESQDKKVILDYIKYFGDNVLLRDNEIAHITSSGFIMNRTLDKVLLVHHNIRNVWSWTGGHADGDKDMLYVSMKEAKEETGLVQIGPLSEDIASVDILPVFRHRKNSRFINAHLHLSVAYILIAEEKAALHICEEENTGVDWFSVDKFTEEYFSEDDLNLYNKLITFARSLSK